MPFWSSDEEDVGRNLAHSRVKKSNESVRQVRANVEIHQSNLEAQLHKHQEALNAKKQEEIEGINEATRDQLKEVEDQEYQRKRELAVEADMVRRIKLEGQNQELEELKMRYKEKEEEERKNVAKLIEDQELTGNEIDKITEKHMVEKANETEKIEKLRERLHDEQKELNSKHAQEFNVTETRSLETRLRMEKELLDREDANHQMVIREEILIRKAIIESQRQLLNVKVVNASNNDIRKVNHAVAAIKISANALETSLEDISNNLTEEIDSDERAVVKTMLRLLSSQLSSLSGELDTLERKSATIRVKEDRENMVQNIKMAKGKITKARNCTSDVERGLNPKFIEFDMKLYRSLRRKINTVTEAITAIQSLATDEDRTREAIGWETETSRRAVQMALEE